jgi:dipeptidyl aminopeptidase/acylaminoacyl peptidase/uncharacterized protein (DUF2132 family)
MTDAPPLPAEKPEPQPRNPLHGVTLETLLSELVEHYGWEGLGQRVRVNSFNTTPSIGSSLKFLRKTPWARAKVESLYLFLQREQARVARAAALANRPPPPPVAAAFGTWKSPFSAELIAAQTLRLGQLAVMGDDILWTEGRPHEQGRNVLVWCSPEDGGKTVDLTPQPLNVRSRVHEYGGGAFTIGPKAAFFINDADSQIWRIRGNEAPAQLTHEGGKRFADMAIDALNKRLICVCEDHSDPSGEPRNSLVGVKFANGQVQKLVTGHDFVSSPTLSPTGRQLAWLSWNHPHMPWDGTTLWRCEVRGDGSLSEPVHVAGGDAESIFQPSWSPNGDLYFVSDRSGWWNLYRARRDEVQALHPMEAEFGVPQWAFGLSTYGFDGRGRVVCSYAQSGQAHLAVLDTRVQPMTFEPLGEPFSQISELKIGADFAVFIAGQPDSPDAVVRLDLQTGEQQVLRKSSTARIDARCVSRAEHISYPTENGQVAHAYFYAPTHVGHCGLPDELPPLVVMTHGGPTGCTTAAFKWAAQYWTSRGFAVVDVNYGGSTGHGRAYRERLNGQWGVVDVDDAVNAARFLVARGDVDAQRLVIRGSSAGGYTTLCALTFREFFKAGASHYGIGDLEALARDTHKFESRYLDKLVGPYPSEQALYQARSPIHHTARLSSPMILLQGAQDKVVPPAQAQAMFEAVKAKGLPVAYLLFEGEQHGFRRPTNVRRALEAELYFYGQVLGFTPADAIEPVEICNLRPG